MNEPDDKMQRTDHDTLIRVETKMDVLVSDMKEMKDGTSAKMAEAEVRQKALELRVKTLEDEYLVAKTNVSAYRVIGGVVGGGIMYLLTQVPNILKTWGLLK